MKSILIVFTVAGMVAISPKVMAQAMPDDDAWLNDAMNKQLYMQGYSDMAVQQMYRNCRAYPAACQGLAAPGGLNAANAALQRQYQENLQRTQQDYDRMNQAIQRYNQGAIQGQ